MPALLRLLVSISKPVLRVLMPTATPVHGVRKPDKPQRHHLPAVLALAVMLALMAACGGKASHPPAMPAAPDHLGTVPVALPDLPAPGGLPRGASAPPSDSDLYRDSHSNWGVVKPNRASSPLPGDNMTFSPDWDPLVSTDPSGLAFAAYQFTNMTEYAGENGLRLEWDTPPADFGNLYIAVADYTRNAWRWFAGSAGGYTAVPGLAGYVNGSGELVVLILLTGTDEAELEWLIAGDRLGVVAYLTSDLNPDPVLNIAPLTVNFNAGFSYVHGGTVTTYDFDCEDDGTFEVSGNTDGLAGYLYSDPGSHTCRVRVHDDAGQQGETSITFWLINPANVPPVADIQATPNNGAAPLPVTLDAGASTDDSGIVKYEWDLDGDGGFELDTGLVSTVDHIFSKDGLNTVSVRVTDGDFTSDTANAAVQLFNGFVHVTVATDQRINDRIAMLITGSGVNARPCVAWQDYPSRQLMFSRATSQYGNTWAATQSLAPPGDKAGFSPCMVANISLRPVIAYGKYISLDSTYDLQTIHATNDDCNIWSGPYAVNLDDDVGGINAMTRASSVPAIISVTKAGYSGQNSIRYYLATDTDGTTWNPGIEILPAAISMQIRDLDITIAFNFMQFHPLAAYCLGGSVTPAIGTIHATVPDGSSWDSPVQFDDHFADTVSLQVSNMVPNLAAGSSSQNGRMFYSRADDSLGTAWSSAPVELTSAGYGGMGKMRLVDARPAICYFSFEGGDLWYIEAADSEGTSWNDPYIVASSGTVGRWNSMVVVNGNPVICYFDDTNDKLMCAYWIP